MTTKEDNDMSKTENDNNENGKKKNDKMRMTKII